MTQQGCDRVKRETLRASGMCIRHAKRPRNPKSAGFCNECLDYFRARYTPKGGHGRNLIPRGTA
jgi:hypothetical protein